MKVVNYAVLITAMLGLSCGEKKDKSTPPVTQLPVSEETHIDEKDDEQTGQKDDEQTGEKNDERTGEKNDEQITSTKAYHIVLMPLSNICIEVSMNEEDDEELSDEERQKFKDGSCPTQGTYSSETSDLSINYNKAGECQFEGNMKFVVYDRKVEITTVGVGQFNEEEAIVTEEEAKKDCEETVSEETVGVWVSASE